MIVTCSIGLSLTIVVFLMYNRQIRAVLESGDRLVGRVSAIALSSVFLTTVFLTTASPAMAGSHLTPTVAALGTTEDTISQEQQGFEEKLKLDPTGDHYKGIEYSSKSVRNQPTDQSLLDKIQPQLSDDVVVAISNGSVRLSGTVKDRATAEEIVEQIKSTAGVHEVAFDLGLESIDQKTVR